MCFDHCYLIYRCMAVVAFCVTVVVITKIIIAHLDKKIKSNEELQKANKETNELLSEIFEKINEQKTKK